MPECPACGSAHTIKNGHIHNGKPKFACKACGRQFVEDAKQKRISEQTKQLIDDLLLERLSLAGIARVTHVSEPWLQHYVNTQYASVPPAVQTLPAKKKALGHPSR